MAVNVPALGPWIVPGIIPFVVVLMKNYQLFAFVQVLQTTMGKIVTTSEGC